MGAFAWWWWWGRGEVFLSDISSSRSHLLSLPSSTACSLLPLSSPIGFKRLSSSLAPRSS